MFSTHRIAIPILFLLVVSGFSSRQLEAQIVRRRDFKTINVHGEEEWERVVKIGKGIQLKAKIEVTSKGNGGLKIANLYLKVYDNHRDVGEYEGGLLHIDLTDLNNDGYRDLIISGLVLYYDDKSNKLMEKENVVFIYIFNPKKKQFKRTYKKASFNLTEGPSRILYDEGHKSKKTKETKNDLD